MLQAHYFDFLPKNFGKREKFIFVSKEITENLLSSSGGFCTFAKLVLFRLLVLVRFVIR